MDRKMTNKMFSATYLNSARTQKIFKPVNIFELLCHIPCLKLSTQYVKDTSAHKHRCTLYFFTLIIR